MCSSLLAELVDIRSRFPIALPRVCAGGLRHGCVHPRGTRRWGGGQAGSDGGVCTPAGRGRRPAGLPDEVENRPGTWPVLLPEALPAPPAVRWSPSRRPTPGRRSQQHGPDNSAVTQVIDARSPMEES